MRMKLANSKKRINWLIALMTVSLLGITGIQAYWLNNSYNLEAEKFDQQVSEALEGVASRLEALETINFLRNNFRLEPFFSAQANNFGGTRSRDSIYRVSDDKGSYEISVSMSDDSIEVIEDRREIHFDNSFFPDSNKRFTVGGVGANTLQSGKIELKLRRMDAVFNQFVRHSFNRKMSLRNRMDQKTLDSILDFEFRSKGIDIPYRYVVVENNRNVMGDQEFRKASVLPESEYVHQAALFPNDLFGHSTLMVFFSGKTNYLLKSMWLTFLVSLVFTAAIIFTFARTLSYTLQQKRISDIKTDFINNMTHEFKTPIATINLAIDALRNPKVINDPLRIEHYSKVIKQENNRMNLQVESVLRMALMDKKELELNFQPVVVSELLDECISHIQLSLESKNGRIEKNFHDNDTELQVDTNHFSNCVINILDNAVKYSIQAPAIKVVTELTRNNLIIIISDKGVGMSKEEQKHIFDRFFRVSSGDIHNIKGHGLGLSYARGIIEAHGGRIDVESEKGKGSKFYIYLPLTMETN